MERGPDGVWQGVRMRFRPIPAVVVAVAIAAASPANAAQSTTVRSGKSCPIASVGAVARDVSGQRLVCAKLTKKTAQWKLPPLGSFLRPVPVGQIGEAGPVGHRFAVRVTRVNLSAAAEVMAGSPAATAPPAGSDFVVVAVDATSVEPSTTNTEHVWGARDDSGAPYASTEGCGGGYGTDFDVTAVRAKGETISGLHCFEVALSAIPSLTLRVEGFGDKPDVFFALR